MSACSLLSSPLPSFYRTSSNSSLERMATTASIPAYLLPGVPVHQPPHLEGDASLATEILPGPPSSASLQQSALKRDPRKHSMTYSYLPPSDPGSTYSGLTAGTLIGQDLEGPRSKRSRVDKGCVAFFIHLAQHICSYKIALLNLCSCLFIAWPLQSDKNSLTCRQSDWSSPASLSS